MEDFSALAYLFGKNLYENLNVPIGLIQSTWGSTSLEVWLSPLVLEKEPILYERALERKELKLCPTKPGRTWWAMIEPLTRFRIAGIIWNQGETNIDFPQDYTKLLTLLIDNWRSAWNYEFPFIYSQIAPYEYKQHLQGALLRDSQRLAMAVPNTGMVINSDLVNDVTEIHPRQKREEANRYARWALNRSYGFKEIPVSGPIYKEMKIEKSQIRIFFFFSEEGLMAKGDKLTHFEIAGEDGHFFPANAIIDGNTVVVSSREVKNPVAVRFAFSNSAIPNLFNKSGLPASTFRTDNWPIDPFK